MKRIAAIVLSVAFLTSCTNSASKDEDVGMSPSSDGEALLTALAGEAWSQEVPSGLEAFSTRTQGLSSLSEGALGYVGFQSFGKTGDSRGRGAQVDIRYVVFESDEEASDFVSDFAADFADHKDARSLDGLHGICVIDADKADECTTADGNVMVRVFSRLGGIADKAQTEELLDLALAHLGAVKEEASL